MTWWTSKVLRNTLNQEVIAEGPPSGSEVLDNIMETMEKSKGQNGSWFLTVVLCILTGIVVAGIMLAIFIPVMQHKERQANEKLREISKHAHTSTTLTPTKESTTKSLTKAADWLLKQRNSQWGWGKEKLLETASGIIAVQLAKPEWCCKSPDSGATINRIKLDILSALLKNSSLDFPEWYGGKLGMYVAALSLSCGNAEDFFGHNLTAILRTHMDNFPKYSFNQMFTYSWAILGLCAAGSGRIDQTYIDRLLLGVRENFTINSIDTMGMTVQALACIQPRTDKIQKALARDVSQIRAKQKSDGSFGNAFSTANAYQALIAAGSIADAKEEEKILDSLRAGQKNDGSFASIPEAFQVLPALSRKTFSKIRTYSEDCASGLTTSLPTNSGTVLRVMIKVKFSIVNNITNDTRDISRDFTVPNNSTFYEVMLIAAKEDSRYTFTAKEYSFGHSITSLSGVAASDNDRTFWSLKLATNTPVKVGVDGLRVSNGDHVIMKFSQY